MSDSFLDEASSITIQFDLYSPIYTLIFEVVHNFQLNLYQKFSSI